MKPSRDTVCGTIKLVRATSTGANVRQVRQMDGSTRLDIQCRVQSTEEGAAGTLAASLPAFHVLASQQAVLPSPGECIVIVQVLLLSLHALVTEHAV